MSDVESKRDEVWKQKYLVLADELESSSANWQRNEKLLCRVIIRLTLATNGLDKLLDPHLESIRDMLKKGRVGDQLWAELDGLSETLIRTDNSAPDVESTDKYASLFEFLEHYSEDSGARQRFSELRSMVYAGKLQDANKLYGALEKAFDANSKLPADSNTKIGFLNKIFQRITHASTSKSIDFELVWNAMIHLLDGLDVPLPFAEDFESLRSKLKSEQDPHGFQTLMSETASLLLKAKLAVKEEQQEIEGFLSQLIQALGELGQRVLDENNSQQTYASDRQVHRESMANQFAELRENTHAATDIDKLQRLVTNRLELISQQLDSHSQKEAERQSQVEQRFADLCVHTQRVEQEAGDLRSKLQVAQSEAHRDPLTGIANRLAYNERLTQEVARWKRFGRPLCLLVWDIDHFKSVNDRFGHAAGDKVLKIIAGEFSTGIRETDFICRYGGEEFVMLLPDTDTEGAILAADKMRIRIEQCQFSSKGKPVPVTLSCGLSQFNDDDQPGYVFERADKALYRAKNDGRNRCVIG